MKKYCGVLRIALGITMLALLLASSANASNLTVCSKGCEYSSIQKAIKASSNGDTILVQSGTYFENVNVNKQLILRGIGNPVVDAAGSGNAITLVADGITLEGFTATGSGYNTYDSPEAKAGIKVTSSNNTMTGNNASNNWNGILLIDSSNNTMNGNNASNNIIGIFLLSSSNNTMTGNNASNNSDSGIALGSSSKNTMRDNMMTGNQKNLNLYIDTDSNFDNIDTSNLVDGKPIYYLIKASDTTYDSSSNAGTLYCISCINVTIKNLNLNKNGNGIYFWNTSQSRIQNVSASNNDIGIYLESSSNNTLSDNNASNNNEGISLRSSSKNKMNSNNASNNYYAISLRSSSKNKMNGNNASNNKFGISLQSSSKNKMNGNNASNNKFGILLQYSNNNKVYNNIFNNTKNVVCISKINTWNTTIQSGTNIIGGSLLGGNFWANPEGTGFSQNCTDVNGDGICDKSYSLDANNIDYLPLAKDKIPPKSVRNLKNITYAKNYINWTWKDPKDIDFKKVMVFIDDKFKKNVSKVKKFYNATNFKANTRHTISTWTVDWNENINKTWTNRSAWTAK